MTILIAVAVFVTVFALILSFTYREQERSGVSKARLARATGSGPSISYAAAPGLALRDRRVSNSEAVDRLLRGLQFSRILDEKLARSDWKLKVSDFLVVTTAVVIIAFVLADVISHAVLIAGLVAVVTAFIPYYLLNRNIKKRRKLFVNQLIEVLTQMANSLKAGFGLLQAMAQAAQEAKHPISTELNQTIRDIQVGSSVEDAFNDLNARVGSDDLDIVITAILIQRGAGGSLSEILEGVTHTMRERIRIRGEIDTLTSQQKLTGYLIGGLPLILAGLFYVINRNYILLLFSTSVGHLMLIGWVIMQGLGFWVIRRILNIEI